ncbi:WG repeat-containing protein [Serpentinicella sp. ANB-PHB4]|uniref:WG repeat-containing protein n=1 Tax=Serpentinicella sp. ANB-PHB4 TaxID=3074076 RepID=UPI0028544691|nr:WG repeat-containing protein [Serpentinicella sp. ANB-PHB4]MDR5658775.1 WG repeat-containing protein [Serpentinicella sp. ANB-PHB4]
MGKNSFKKGIVWTLTVLMIFSLMPNLVGGAFAQAANTFVEPEYVYDNVYHSYEGYVAVMKDGKWGFTNENGELILEPVYNQVWVSGHGLARVSNEEGMWGLVNKDGKEIVKPTYNRIHGFNEGLALVEHENGFGFINKEGKEIISPQYVEARPFGNGFAPVQNEEEKWGFINKKGEEVVEPRYVNVTYFWGDLAAVQNEEKKWGFVDKEGRVVVEPKYDEIISYLLGELTAFKNDEEKWGFIDQEGKEIIEPKYKQVGWNFSDGLLPVKNEEGNWGFIDKEGENVIEPKYNEVNSFVGGLAGVKNENDEWGIINKEGKEIVSPKYSYVRSFWEGLIGMQNEERKWGIVNQVGEELVKPQYNRLGFSYSEGFLAVQNEESKWGFIDKEGNGVVEPKYLWVGNFNEGLAEVYEEEWQRSIIDTNGQELSVLSIYDSIDSGIVDGYIQVSKGDKRGVVDREGNVVVLIEDRGLMLFRNGILGVEKEGKWGVVNLNTLLEEPEEKPKQEEPIDEESGEKPVDKEEPAQPTKVETRLTRKEFTAKETQNIQIEEKVVLNVPTNIWTKAINKAIKDAGLDSFENVEIKIEEVGATIGYAVDNLKYVAPVFDFSLMADNTRITQFGEKIEMTFSFDPEAVENEDNLSVYWFNPEENKWEAIDSKLGEGNTIIGMTDHWSRFTVFEDTAAEGAEEEKQSDNPKTGDKGIAPYIVLALVSGAVLFINRKQVKIN